MKPLTAFWTVPLLAVLSVGAAAAPSLLVAARTGDMPAVRALLKQQVEVNAAEADGTTALHWAVHHDNLEAVDLLLTAGANVRAVNRYGVTPLNLAATNGNAAVVERLLKAGAEANVALPEGETVLMTAARSGNVAAVKVLLAHGGGNVTDVDKNGYTALHGAVHRGGSMPIIRLLVGNGARLDARNSKGWLPLTIAEGIEYTPDIFKRYPETAEALRQMMRERGLPIPAVEN